jgi:hypothetical protein
MVCCIKKFPLDAAGSCGATEADVAAVLNGMRVLNEAVQEEQETPAKAEGAEDDTPEWKLECRRKYVDCQQYDWLGNCHDCFRYCEGQHEWPEHLCRRRKRGE